MRSLAAVTVLILMTACQAPPEMTDADPGQIEDQAKQAIADQWAGFTDAVLDLDYEGWAAYWTQDARVLSPGMDLSGTALFEVVRGMFESGMQIHTIDVQSFETFVHGDVAYQIGQMDETLQTPGGDSDEAHDYIFTRWEQQSDGVWRISRFLGGPRDAPPEG